MPIYEYRCSSCGFQKEYLQKITNPVMTACPECDKQTFSKMLTAAGFQLKGSGWYASDFKNSGAKPAAKTEGKDKSAGEADGKEKSDTQADGREKSDTKFDGKEKSDTKSDGKEKSDTKSDGKTEAKSETPGRGTGASPACS